MSGKQLKFIHITKCAGTCIESAGKHKGYLWGLFDDEYFVDGHKYWHYIFPNLNKETKEKYDWFTVVRNPYTRILSEYSCRWGGIGSDTSIVHTKQEMNNYLIERIQTRSMAGCHYTEQFKYLDPSTTIHVLKFENLNEEFEQLMTQYNIEGIVLEKLNTHKERMNTNVTYFTLSDFSNELINLINTVYQKDFELFGYEQMDVSSRTDM